MNNSSPAAACVICRGPSPACPSDCPSCRRMWPRRKLTPPTKSPSGVGRTHAKTFPLFSARRSTGLPKRVLSRPASRWAPIAAYASGWSFGRNSQLKSISKAGALREDTLSREHQGPRAVLNALERMADGYGFACLGIRQDLAIAEGQLRDYQARLGKSFTHEDYHIGPDELA